MNKEIPITLGEYLAIVTVAELARELDMQPYELLAFGDLGVMTDDARLTPEAVAMIREAVAESDTAKNLNL
jgi:hypothetical protein